MQFGFVYENERTWTPASVEFGRKNERLFFAAAQFHNRVESTRVVDFDEKFTVFPHELFGIAEERLECFGITLEMRGAFGMPLLFRIEVGPSGAVELRFEGISPLRGGRELVKKGARWRYSTRRFVRFRRNGQASIRWQVDDAGNVGFREGVGIGKSAAEIAWEENRGAVMVPAKYVVVAVRASELEINMNSLRDCEGGAVSVDEQTLRRIRNQLEQRGLSAPVHASDHHDVRHGSAPAHSIRWPVDAPQRAEAFDMKPDDLQVGFD